MSKHGGKRDGAGRPPSPDIEKMRNVSVRLPNWMIDRLSEIDEDRSWLIRQALIQTFKLKPPAEVREKFAAEWQQKQEKHRKKTRG